MWWDRQRPWTVVVPPITAGLLMLGFFFLFDRWDKLENPIASQLAIVAALLGFLTGIAVQRVTQWWLLAIPAAITAGAALWAYFAPHDTPEDSQFRQVLIVLTVMLAVTAAAVNIPQIARGRR